MARVSAGYNGPEVLLHAKFYDNTTTDSEWNELIAVSGTAEGAFPSEADVWQHISQSVELAAPPAHFMHWFVGNGQVTTARPNTAGSRFITALQVTAPDGTTLLPDGDFPNGEDMAARTADSGWQGAFGLFRIVPAPCATASAPAVRSWPLAVARSYDGHFWEALHPADQAHASVAGCDADGCDMHLLVEEQYAFEMQVITVLPPSRAQLAVKLLTQATFGPTRHEIASLSNGSANMSFDAGGRWAHTWLASQMALPATLHRAHYRQRVNSRLAWPLSAGGVRHACEAGSRWRRYALTVEDVGSAIEVRVGVTGVLELHVAGVIRSELPPLSPYDALNVAPEAPYVGELCGVVEVSGGLVRVMPSCSGISRTDMTQVMNPNVSLVYSASATVATTWVVSSAEDVSLVPLSWPGTVSPSPGGHPDDLMDLPTSQSDVYLVSYVSAAARTACPLSAANQAGALLDRGGTLFYHDPRLKMLTNTLEHPAELTEAAASALESCPAVEKSVLFEQSCVRRPTCAPVTFGSTSFVLNQTTIVAFHEHGGLFVHAMRGLRLETSAAASPCDGLSRWVRLAEDCGASETALDAETKATLASAIRRDAEASSWFVRDVSVPNTASCTSFYDGVSAVGAKVSVDGACWAHNHPDELNVYDLSYWSLSHDGNDLFATNDKPIQRFAKQSMWEAQFPSSHPMSRWDEKKGTFALLGVLGDVVDFATLPSSVQHTDVALAFGAAVSLDTGGFLACGSRGEVGNEMTLDHHYSFYLRSADSSDRARHSPHGWKNAKSMVHATVVLTAADQLRQRVAWALSQIYIVAEAGVQFSEEAEGWTSAYDIFVANAFGNLRDVLREVAYNPIMGDFLTYHGSASLASSGSAPDENFARETMQLHTIGLWELHAENGTQKLDEHGEPIPTYTNVDVVSFARVWTGFERTAFRGNIETRMSSTSPNRIDPMRIVASKHDSLPKSNLHSGYLGDGYPLCTEWPERAFLRRGAKFSYVGSSPTARQHRLNTHASSLDQAVVLNDTTSALRHALCAPREDCTWPNIVVLDANLSCDGQECEVDTPVLVVAQTSAGPAYYEFLFPPCVELTFYQGMVAKKSQSTICADPSTLSAGVACCSPAQRAQGTAFNGWVTSFCSYPGELTTFATAVRRCAIDNYLGDRNYGGYGQTCESYYSVSGCGAWDEYSWLDVECSMRVLVGSTGEISSIHTNSTSSIHTLPGAESHVVSVPWEGGQFPKIADGCGAGSSAVCSVYGRGCLCDTSVSTSAVFTNRHALPTRAQIEAQLHIGSPAPDVFDGGAYEVCTTPSCAAVADEVAVHTRVHTRTASAGAIDEHTIFTVARNGTRVTHFANKRSMVRLGTEYAFRNPVSFMNDARQFARDAHNEVDALIDHLFWHVNTAPFIGRRLIQRLVTSNPSPRYVGAVGAAFRAGMVPSPLDGDQSLSSRLSLSGAYGDLGATVTAILLDPEARSFTVDADPSHGQLREPLLKLLHLMRAFEFQPVHGRQVELEALDTRIGMRPFGAPSVFSFFRPEYSPDGPVSASGLVSPESEIATGPYLVGLINSMSALIRDGLSSCGQGVGSAVQGARCLGHSVSSVSSEIRSRSDGLLQYVPEAVLAETAHFAMPTILGGVGNEEGNATVELSVAAAARGGGPPGARVVVHQRWPSSSYWKVSLKVNPGWDGNYHSTLSGPQPVLYRASFWVRSPSCDECQVTAVTDLLGPWITSKSVAFTPEWQQHDLFFLSPRPEGSRFRVLALYFGKSLGEFHVTDCSLAALSAAAIVDELALMLTADRLAASHREAIVGAYERELALQASSLKQDRRALEQAGLMAAQELVVLSPEFHTTPFNMLRTSPRVQPSPPPPGGSAYKAIVYLFLGGGLDSYNVLVPLDRCHSHGDLFAAYQQARGNVALSSASLLPINSTSSPQPCTDFGVHPKLKFVQRAYHEGDAAFVANVGPLIEPTSKAQYEAGTARLPPSLFAHNVQTACTQNVHAEATTTAKGVLGRLLSVLSSPSAEEGRPPMKTASYSIAGTSKLLEGGPPPQMLSQAGVVRFSRYEQLTQGLANLTSLESESAFAESYSSLLEKFVHGAEALSSTLDGIELEQSFPATGLGNQLQQVARIISARDELGAERDAFFVQLGGFDTHANLFETLNSKLGEVDDALESFAAEMRSRGAWDSVVVQVASEFGRTITSNGLGTDHGWGGNAILLGGSVKGGRILGDFPASLGTDSELHVGRGRLVPTLSWEAVWNAHAAWLGVPPPRMSEVLPNVDRFAGQLLNESQVFRVH